MEPLRIAVAGLGRMGWVHASNVHDLARETGACAIAALVDKDTGKARRFADERGLAVPVFASVEELAVSGLCQATLIITPTEHHREHAKLLLQAGHRVLLEKPLTGTLEGDTAFAAELDRDYPDRVMLAFQRRFDPALAFAQELMSAGAVGKVFKIYSALEDSGPPPDGYQSGGILPDMAVHNVDEILWLTGRMPVSALAIGSRLYNYGVASCVEDFDDAMLYLWFEGDLMGQVQVSRNHVSGYRVESVIYGDQGQIHVGRFEQKPLEAVVEAYGRRGAKEPIAWRVFPGSDGRPGPEFVDRFLYAYKAEVAAFIDCCRKGAAFPAGHHDGLRAQRVIAAGMRAAITRSAAQPV
jgi:myo-inositol 2-dehydrogenase/D-chiro-inositol 1-dehydrogenase